MHWRWLDLDQAAIGDEIGAGKKAGIVRGEKGRGRGDFLRPARTAERRLPDHAGATRDAIAWLGSRMRRAASQAQGWASARRKAIRSRRGPAASRPVVFADR